MSNEEELCFRFDPTDEEVIKHYLIPKINNQLQYDFIETKNVYAKEPWLLEHHDSSFFMENEWYYFTTRSQVSDIKIGCGKKANRKITGDDSENKIGCVKNAKRKKITGDNDGVVDRGNWKANSKEYIVDSETGKIIGIKQTLKFFPTKKQKTGDDGTGASDRGSDSSWIMKEFMLVEGDKFQELVVCRIQELKKSNEAHDQRESVLA